MYFNAVNLSQILYIGFWTDTFKEKYHMGDIAD
jgi:hypothetical protein